MLRHASCDNASVLLHMLEVIDVIGQETKAPEARQQLLRHVSLIQAESQAGDLIEQDRQAIQLSGRSLTDEIGRRAMSANIALAQPREKLAVVHARAHARRRGAQ